MHRTAIRESRGDQVFVAFIATILSLTLVIVLYPLIYIVSSSFSSVPAVVSGRVWLLPVEPSLEGYKAVFSNKGVMRGYANGAFYTFFGTLLNVILTVMVAFPLSRADFVGRGFLMFFLTFTILFSGGLIPTYLVVRRLGMIDTRWAMIIPQALAVWNVIVARTFFQTTIPEELVEAAEIDGCSDIYFVWSVVLPLSTPIVAVLTLMYAVFHWNAYFDAMIYLNSDRLYPLQIVLRNILILHQDISTMGIRSVREQLRHQGLADLLKYSLIVVGSAPLLAAYPFAQRYFVKGILIGSLKG